MGFFFPSFSSLALLNLDRSRRCRTTTFSYNETKTNFGDLVVYPKLDFLRFLSFMSHKIGILPVWFTVFLSSSETCQ
ncbi:hypothetical protein ACFX1R_000771 [Malus domestica]